MTEQELYDYLYVVEWDDSVHRPPYITMHGIKLNPEVSRASFETFMAEQGIPLVAQVSTKAGAVAAQYLLTDVTGDPPLRFEELDLSLESFGERVAVTKYRIVLSWRKPATE